MSFRSWVLLLRLLCAPCVTSSQVFMSVLMVSFLILRVCLTDAGSPHLHLGRFMTAAGHGQ